MLVITESVLSPARRPKTAAIPYPNPEPKPISSPVKFSAILRDESGKEVELIGLELTPVSSVWHLRYPAAEAVYTGSDLELQKAWLRVEDSICMNARIIFSDGSSMVTNGALSARYEDGVVSLYTGWPRAIDITDVQRIVLGDLVLWENK